MNRIDGTPAGVIRIGSSVSTLPEIATRLMSRDSRQLAAAGCTGGFASPSPSAAVRDFDFSSFIIGDGATSASLREMVR